MFLWTDASGTRGQGGVFSSVKPYEPSHITWSQAFSKPLSRHHREKDINYKEMNAVLVALRLWGEHFTHSRLVVHTDNSVVFHGLQHWTTRSSAISPLREIALLSAKQDIQIQPIWIPSQENLLADLLSRRDFKKLANTFPLLTQHTIHRHPGTKTSTSPALLPATFGGVSAPTPDGHMEQPAGATLPAAQ